MARLLFFLLFSLFSLVVRAQEYYLDFKAQSLPAIGQAVAVEQVVDGRETNAAIGLVYQGLGNKAAAVLFRHDLATDLTAFLKTQLPAQAASYPVVLCVRQLRVSEVPGNFSEKATADLALDVYLHLLDGYHFTRSTGSHISSRTLDGTGSHIGHLVQLLGQCLGQLDSADWRGAAAHPALQLSQLRADVPAVLAGGGRRGPAPAILRETPHRGIYYRFEQFLANQPDSTLPLRLDTIRMPNYKSQLTQLKWAGVARVRPLVLVAPNEWRAPPATWGFSDGQQVFVEHNKRFFPLMRQGQFFTFVGEAPLDVEYARAAAYAQARAQVTMVASVGVPNHSAEPAAYSLDMRTGELAPYPGTQRPTRADTAYVYIYRPTQTITPERVSVFINNRQVGSLLPGEYLEVPWPHYAKPFQLCLDGLGTAKPCQYLVPNTARQSYLKVDLASTPGPWQWVPAAQGEADLDKLDKLHK